MASNKPRLSRYIGLQVGAKSCAIYGLVNPDSDAQLRDPQLLEITDVERVKLVRVYRRGYGSTMSPADANAVVSAYKERRK